MKVALPEVCVRSMVDPSWIPDLWNKQPTRTAAASFGVTTVSPIGGVSQRPVSLRILIKVWRKKKRIFTQVAALTYTTFEHAKAHVEVVGAWLGELHLVGDFITVVRAAFTKQRPFLGGGGVSSQNR